MDISHKKMKVKDQNVGGGGWREGSADKRASALAGDQGSVPAHGGSSQPSELWV